MTSQITPYTPTLMQRLLGRQYKWWYLVKFKFTGRTVSTLDNAFFVFGHIAMLLSTILIWYIANDKVIDTQLQSKWTYFIIGELYFNLIYIFAEYYAYEVIRGGHVKDLLIPQNFFILQLFNNYGAAALQNLIKGCLLTSITIIAVFTGNISHFDPIKIPLLVILIPISLIIFFCMEIMVAFSGFFMKQVNGVILNFGIFSSILMGSRFPLDLLIPQNSVLFFNPFAYLFHHPMQIYLGKYSPLETFYVFLGGIGWCIVLYFLANYIFKRGLKRNEAVGL